MIITIDDSVDVRKSVWLIVTENGITNPELSESGNGMKPNEGNTGKNAISNLERSTPWETVKLYMCYTYM